MKKKNNKKDDREPLKIIVVGNMELWIFDPHAYLAWEKVYSVPGLMAKKRRSAELPPSRLPGGLLRPSLRQVRMGRLVSTCK